MVSTGGKIAIAVTVVFVVILGIVVWVMQRQKHTLLATTGKQIVAGVPIQTMGAGVHKVPLAYRPVDAAGAAWGQTQKGAKWVGGRAIAGGKWVGDRVKAGKKWVGKQATKYGDWKIERNLAGAGKEYDAVVARLEKAQIAKQARDQALKSAATSHLQTKNLLVSRKADKVQPRAPLPEIGTKGTAFTSGDIGEYMKQGRGGALPRPPSYAGQGVQFTTPVPSTAPRRSLPAKPAPTNLLD